MASKMVVVCMSWALMGCAVRPEINEFTGLKTVDIVDKIRCEAREAIAARGVVAPRRNEKFPITHSFVDDEPREGEPAKIRRPSNIDYRGAAIAYEFTFDLWDKGKFDSNYSLAKSFFGGGSAGVTIGGTYSNDRSSKRIFAMSDNFVDLLMKVPEDCSEKYSKNYAVPVAGRVGLKEVVDTFFDLYDHGKMKTSEEFGLMQETIKFKTVLTLTGGPSLTFLSVGQKWHASGANVTATSTREEEHQVIISFAMPSSAKPAKAKTEAKALNAISQRRSLMLLQTLRDIDSTRSGTLN